jgi:hypothetical protein
VVSGRDSGRPPFQAVEGVMAGGGSVSDEVVDGGLGVVDLLLNVVGDGGGQEWLGVDAVPFVDGRVVAIDRRWVLPASPSASAGGPVGGASGGVGSGSGRP